MIEYIWDVTGSSDDEIEKFVGYLLLLGFDSFYQEENKLHAFVENDMIDSKTFVQHLQTLPPFVFNPLQFEQRNLNEENWNAIWEANYEPVVIGNFLHIRAPFHESRAHDYAYEIIIHPKMSFGTGHHPTTAGMLEAMHSFNLEGKTVVDMGCGTGILAIFASLKRANKVIAIDNNPICVENAAENIHLNKIKNVEIITGNIDSLSENMCDVLLANITRNTLLEHIPHYARALRPGGYLLMSGYYIDDFHQIFTMCNRHNMQHVKNNVNNHWCISIFQKLTH